MRQPSPTVPPVSTRRKSSVSSGRTTHTELTPCAWLTLRSGTTISSRSGPTFASTRANCPGLSDCSGLGNLTTITNVPVAVETSLRVKP